MEYVKWIARIGTIYIAAYLAWSAVKYLKAKKEASDGGN